MRVVASAMAMVAGMTLAGMMTAGTAHAQTLDVYIGNGGGYASPYASPSYASTYAARWGDDDDDGGLAQRICSGQWARQLEQRVNHERDEDEVDDDTADHMHQAIDRLEDKQRHECSEGDWRAVQSLARQYDRIGQWLDTSAHGQQREPRW